MTEKDTECEERFDPLSGRNAQHKAGFLATELKTRQV